MADLEVTDRLTIPDAELSESFARASGPGGQNVNKVETKAELRWDLANSAAVSDADREWLMERLRTRLTADGTLVVTSQRTRDQARNRADARVKLADLVREALARPTPRRPTRPSRGAVERRLQAKKQRAQRKRTRQSPDDSE
jgi:ribosome-associated protein